MNTQFDYNLLTADYARKLTTDARKELERKEYIYIKEQIVCATERGDSYVTLSKKISDYSKEQLEKDGFNVIMEKEDSMTINSITNIISGPSEYWTTTIKW